MALSSLRLRRAVTLSSYLLKHHCSFSTNSSLSSSFVLQSHISSSFGADVLQNPRNHLRIQSHWFRSSSLSSSSSRSSYNDDDKISPDTILFEGCDYNHWLITMEFPKDPKPTPEEMVETYVQTLAKVVGSVEEAKKKMYACSTTTYTGFQAVMTEEMSEKFRGLPGVVFILPDSYIDPVNKEYGGDKYINGTIIPRPPPVQYGRSQGRYGDRNRNYDRPRYERQRDPMPMQQGNQPYDRQGSMQGDGRNYGAQQNYGQQPNYGPTGQGECRDSMPMGSRDLAPGGRDNYQGERRDPMPSYQRNYNQGDQGNYFSQERRDFAQGDRRDYAPPEHRDFRGDNRNVGPPRGGEYQQGADSGYGQSYPGHGQGAGSGYGQSYPGQGQGAGSGYGQSYPGQGQGAGSGYGQNYPGQGQGAGSGYGQSYPGHGEGQRFSQVEQRDGMQGEQSNHTPMGQMGNDQGRY